MGVKRVGWIQFNDAQRRLQSPENVTPSRLASKRKSASALAADLPFSEEVKEAVTPGCVRGRPNFR